MLAIIPFSDEYTHSQVLEGPTILDIRQGRLESFEFDINLRRGGFCFSDLEIQVYQSNKFKSEKSDFDVQPWPRIHQWP